MARGWACLLYHDVRPELAPPGGGPDRFAVTVDAFGRQLDRIRALGVRGCSIEQAMARPDGCVAISFDDGEAGLYRYALPALVERGMTATFFITTSWVGTPGYVTWAELREMRAAGMSIQSHTRTHPLLSELGADRLLAELRDSRRELDDALGQATDTLALPGGDEPRPPLRHLLAEAGYRVVATSRWGLNRPHAAVADGVRRAFRCTVRGEPPLGGFTRVVRGDPWVLGYQRVRGAALETMRSRLGTRRYGVLRKRFLDTLGAVR